jgi:hypothetical protein
LRRAEKIFLEGTEIFVNAGIFPVPALDEGSIADEWDGLMAARNPTSRKRKAIARKSCKARSAFGFDRITGKNPIELLLFSPARFLNT